jgi:hypothetical protein
MNNESEFTLIGGEIEKREPKKRLDRVSKNPLATTPKRLLDEAIKYIEELPEGEEFFLSELFQGVYWNRIDKGTRLSFGLLFKSSELDLDIEYVDKFSNQILYRKKSKHK